MIVGAMWPKDGDDPEVDGQSLEDDVLVIDRDNR